MRFAPIWITVLSALLITACSTVPKDGGEKTDVGVWEGRVQVTNNKTKQRKWVNVIWVSDSAKKRMKIDVRAVLDIPVATFLRDNGEAHLWMFTEAKHYYSKSPRTLFANLVKFDFDPDLFFSILGNPRSLGQQWSCKNLDYIYKCHSQKQKTKVMIDHQQNNVRFIKVHRGEKTLQMRLTRSKVQIEDGLFRPIPLTQFKTIQI